jgi:hypothetical protein
MAEVKNMAIEIKLVCGAGHRKYAAMTPEEAQNIVSKVESGQVKDAPRGAYFIINENTKRLIGKLDIKYGQKLLLVPAIQGG